jgi:signal transduction histidine kinase
MPSGHGYDRAGMGRGQQDWNRFGARMFFRFLMLVMVGLVAIGALGAVLFESVSWWAGLIIVLLVWLVLFGVGRGIRRNFVPARELIRAAGALADGDYTARAQAPESPAMRPAVESFNEMARRLEQADAQRRRLLADLGHELRTPLTVVRGEIEAMLDGVHRPDAEHLDLLLGEVAVMERLLEDLRTLSLAEAGALALFREPTDLAALVGDVGDTHRRSADEAGVVVVTRLDPTIGDVNVDPVRIREVVSNLVVNALAAMPDGGALTLRTREVGDEVVIEVEDTGVGIDAALVDTVFDRFQKGATSPGSGLGLTISRDLVEAHGGTIEMSSEPGVGTQVRVTLPITPAAHARHA